MKFQEHPFQEEEGTEHGNIITELPFENRYDDASKGDRKKVKAKRDEGKGKQRSS